MRRQTPEYVRVALRLARQALKFVDKAALVCKGTVLDKLVEHSQGHVVEPLGR